jgi:hypothetical protein
MISTQTNIYESSTIDSTTYDYTNKDLYVAFKSGTTYLYKNVNTAVYQEFRDSDSQGKSLNALIKNNEDITFEKLENGLEV